MTGLTPLAPVAQHGAPRAGGAHAACLDRPAPPGAAPMSAAADVAAWLGAGRVVFAPTWFSNLEVVAATGGAPAA